MSDTREEIEPSALKEQLGQPTPPTVIDVREAWEHALGALPTAKLVSLASLSNAPLVADLPHDKPVVTYCHHGVRSLRARQTLLELGFTNVQSLRGGIDAWATDVDGSVGRY